MANTLYASFSDPEMAEKAIGALLDHGVRGEDVTVVTNETWSRSRYGDFDDDHDADDVEDHAKAGVTTTTAGDAASGAAKGAGIGLGVGAAAALASMFIPGFGLVMGGGALASALAGLATTTAGGAIAGGATGYLKDQGVPD